MSGRILARNSKFGKQWPHRALNFLPPAQLWKYLIWKSGGTTPEPILNLGLGLQKVKKILVFLPESLQDLLVLLPMLQTLKHEVVGSEFCFVGKRQFLPFLSAVFGNAQSLTLDEQGFFWGDPHFKELGKTVLTFQPDLSLDLNPFKSPLQAYLIRIARASFRVQLEEKYPLPFANITLGSGPTENLLGISLSLPQLWNFTEQPLKNKWSRLKPSPENLTEARNRLLAKGLLPEKTELILWQNSTSTGEQELLQKKVFERKPTGEQAALAIIVATGDLFKNSLPNSEILHALPAFEVESVGLLLGFFYQTLQSVGTNGPVLHLASLADTQVEAHFKKEDAPYDTSFLNPKFKALYSA